MFHKDLLKVSLSQSGKRLLRIIFGADSKKFSPVKTMADSAIKIT